MLHKTCRKLRLGVAAGIASHRVIMRQIQNHHPHTAPSRRADYLPFPCLVTHDQKADLNHRARSSVVENRSVQRPVRS